MNKLKLFLAACTLTAGGMTANAQTDVTSTYIKNADFSSTDGWSAVTSASFKDYGNGLIGTYGVRTAEGQAVSTVDETHLATEYCVGFECRWSNSYASYTQTTSKLTEGVYTLTFDVENTNGQTTGADYANRFFVTVGGNTYTDASTEWMNGKSAWTTHSITFSVTESTTATISLGYGTGSNNLGSTYTPTLHVSHLKLTWTDPLEAAKADWTAAREAAVAALDNAEYANVTGDERTALVNAIETYAEQPDSKSELEAQTAAFNSAVSAFTVAKTSYDALAEINAVAKAVGIETADATTADLAATASQTQNVAVYNHVKSSAYNYTVSLGDWTPTGSSKEDKGQHWNGNSTTTYYEPDQWSAASVSWNLKQDKVLPAGTYVLMATGRRSGSLEMTMSVKNGDEAIGAVSSFPAQDTGKGVDTSGAANFGEGTFANTNGRGWEWRFIPFTLSEETIVTLDVTATSGTTHQWASICAFELRSVAEVNPYRLALMQSITDAKAIDVVTNVGTGVFQKPADAVTTFQSAISAAETVRDNGSATDEELQTATTDLTAAIAAFDAVELNAPDAEQLYNIAVATAGHAKENNPIIIVPGSTTANNPTGYVLNCNFESNPNLSQAFKFTKVSGNYYTISTTLGNNVVYITNGNQNGSAAGWKKAQIQATTDATKALSFRIVASENQGAFKIYNPEEGNFVACQTGGNIYTENGNADFKLVETFKPSITVNTTDAGYGTLMLPFAVTVLPSGVKAYTCAAVEGETLTLEPVNALAANTPYIIEGAWEEILTGDAQGINLTTTAGLLTGVYTEYATQGGEYVLQKHGNEVAFYQVGTDENDAKPVVAANRAYLTYDASTDARAFFFPSNEATGISAISALVDGQAEIFNEGGQKLQSLQKGINILRTSDGRTVKLMVK